MFFLKMKNSGCVKFVENIKKLFLKHFPLKSTRRKLFRWYRGVFLEDGCRSMSAKPAGKCGHTKRTSQVPLRIRMRLKTFNYIYIHILNVFMQMIRSVHVSLTPWWMYFM